MSNTEQRLGKLEEMVETLTEGAIDAAGTSLKERAESMANFEALCAIARHVGIDLAWFAKTHRERSRYWHDLYLRAAESVSADLGAALDSRDPEDVSDLLDEEGWPGMPDHLRPGKWDPDQKKE